jgi:hypothetical protein
MMVNSQFSYVGVTMSRQMSIFKMADELSILSNLYKYGQLKTHVYFDIIDTKIVPIICHGSELREPIEHIYIYDS